MKMGLNVGKTRIECELRASGRLGRRTTKFRVRADSDHDKPVVEIVLARTFNPAGPNLVWV